MNIFIAPDSFKGSISAIGAAEAIKKGVFRALPVASTFSVPMADGGEGTLAAIAREFHTVGVRDPLGRSITAEYGITADGKTAVIEIANASGIERLHVEELDACRASSFGTGQLIADALEKGYREFLICLGGSATNDGATGLLKALGFRFLNEAGEELTEGGLALRDLTVIDDQHVPAIVYESSFQVACDVSNPLLGAQGASAIFGPQKGATPEQVLLLDEGLRVFADCIEKLRSVRVHELRGGGAAGGAAAGLVGLLGAQLKPGLELVLDKLNVREFFEKETFDLVITGEGKLDAQTASGKVVAGLAEFASGYGVPVLALAGKVEGDLAPLYQRGLTAAFSIANGPMSLTESMEQAATLLEHAAEQAVRLWAAGRWIGDSISGSGIQSAENGIK